jgi:hypothetical protein
MSCTLIRCTYDINLELIQLLLQEFLILAPWWPSQESDLTKIYFPKGVDLGVHMCAKFQVNNSSGYETCLLTNTRRTMDEGRRTTDDDG